MLAAPLTMMFLLSFWTQDYLVLDKTFTLNNYIDVANCDHEAGNCEGDTGATDSHTITIKLKDGRGSDANVKFRIMSTSPGVSARFADDGKELKVKGVGDVTLKLEYDDNPGYAGEAVRSITINGTKWTKKRTEYGEETKTLKITQNTAASTAFTKSGSDENNIDWFLEDMDGDGYDADVDCNDNDNNIHPYAGDTQGGEDTDCDGLDCEAGFHSNGRYFAVCVDIQTPSNAKANCESNNFFDGLATINSSLENSI